MRGTTLQLITICRALANKAPPQPLSASGRKQAEDEAAGTDLGKSSEQGTGAARPCLLLLMALQPIFADSLS